MNHTKFQEYITLSFLGEISPGELEELNQHLITCSDCKQFYAEEKKLYTLLEESPAPEPDAYLLEESRKELKSAIRRKTNEGGFGKFIDSLLQLITGYYKPAFAMAVLLVAGFFAGTYYNKLNTQPFPEGSKIYELEDLLESGIRVSNIRLTENPKKKDEVEISFQAHKDITVRGSFKDKGIQSLVMYSVLNEDNPGIRLTTLNVLSSATTKKYDPDIKAAIATIVKSDDNPGVRKEGIKLLKSLPYDNDIKQALLYVLMNDKNSGNRIDAINALLELNNGVKVKDPDILNVFKSQMENESNNYIKYRVKSVLDEKVTND